jgi:hypothetical protein
MHTHTRHHTHQDDHYKKKTHKGKPKRNWNSCVLLVRMENGAAAMKTSMVVPQKNLKYNYHLI